MLSLSPAKLLVILVVALIVLGPDKLPHMARQLGAFWHDIRLWRGRIESEVRDTFPNLPPSHEVARVVRSPLAFLDRLADEHERTLESEEPDGAAASDTVATSPGTDSSPAAPASGTTPEMANGAAPASNGAGVPKRSGDGPTGYGSAPRPAPGVVAADDPSMN
jgi:sec-independent protein translocase protein TatB